MKRSVISERREIILTIFLVISLILISGVMSIFVLTDPGLLSSLTLARVATEVERQSAGNLDWDYHCAYSGHALLGHMYDARQL